MKVKNDFITNSSSTSFIIINHSNKTKTLVDFVKENPNLIEAFKEIYYWHKNDPKYNQTELIKSAKENNITFKPGEEKVCIFGDESETLIGNVFDYILRSGGSNKSFTWWYKESLR